MTLRPPVDESWKALGLHVWAPILVAAPALAFPAVKPVASVILVALALIALVVAAKYGPNPALTWRSVRSPLSWPIGLVLALAAVGTALSAYPTWSVPKLTSLVLGVLVARATVLTATSPARLRSIAAIYGAFGLAIVITAAVAGPQWRGLGSGFFQNLAGQVVPSLITIPGAETGPNTNAIGGTTLFFIPFCVAMVLMWPGESDHTRTRESYRRDRLVDRLPWLLGFIVLTFVLLISQSRTSWLSAIAGVALVVAARYRAVRWGLSGLIAATALFMLWYGPNAAVQGLLHGSRSYIGFFDNSDRPTIWRFAIAAIQAHPWFGVGLGAFREVIHGMTVNGATYSLPVPHAHNQFLQVALDLGVPGLAAYVALLFAATRLTWQVYHAIPLDGRLRGLTLGLWSSLLAIHLFGLLDCIALGAKVGIFFWMHLALIAAVARLAGVAAPGPNAGRPFRR